MENINPFIKLHKNYDYDLELYNKKVLKSIVQKHFEIYLDEFDPRKDYEFESPFIVYFGKTPLEHHIINFFYYKIANGASFKNSDEKIINYLVKLEFELYPYDTFQKLNNLLDDDLKISFNKFISMLKEFNIDIKNESNLFNENFKNL